LICHKLDLICFKLYKISHKLDLVCFELYKISHKLDLICSELYKISHKLDLVCFELDLVSHGLYKISHKLDLVSHGLDQVGFELDQITLAPLLRQEAEHLHSERPQGPPHHWPLSDHTTEWMEYVYGLRILLTKVETTLGKLQGAHHQSKHQRRRQEGE
jgi:hypothetical protein